MGLLLIEHWIVMSEVPGSILIGREKVSVTFGAHTGTWVIFVRRE
jgi:hypothetical protein